jgi:hypothetical protein
MELAEDERSRFGTVAMLVAHVTGMLPYLNSTPALVPRQNAAACLARCNRLLAAMIQLQASGYPDVVGLGARPLLECWYLGMFLLVSPDEAMSVIGAAHKHQLRNLDESWGDVASSWDHIEVGMKSTSINWNNLSKRVGELLRESGETGADNTSKRLYEVLFRSESALSVHGGLGVFIGHVTGAGSPSLGIEEIREEPEEDGSMRIRLAAALVESLARAIARKFGLSTYQIDQLGRRLFAEGAAEIAANNDGQA